MRDVAGKGGIVPRAALPPLGLAAGFAAGVLLGGEAGGQDPALLAVIRFMAVVRSAMALAAAAGAAWRLSWQPGGPALGYAVACFLMAAGVWPIWAGSATLLGAALVNGGLLLAAGTAWRDRSGWRAALARRRGR